MKHEVLQVTIGRAHGTAKPRRNKDANRSQPFGMNVEKPENFRLRKPDGMQDSAGLQFIILEPENQSLDRRAAHPQPRLLQSVVRRPAYPARSAPRRTLPLDR